MQDITNTMLDPIMSKNGQYTVLSYGLDKYAAYKVHPNSDFERVSIYNCDQYNEDGSLFQFSEVNAKGKLIATYMCESYNKEGALTKVSKLNTDGTTDMMYYDYEGDGVIDQTERYEYNDDRSVKDVIVDKKADGKEDLMYTAEQKIHYLGPWYKKVAGFFDRLVVAINKVKQIEFPQYQPTE